MFEQHLETMRRAVFEMSLRQHPPETVLILREHAEFLGVKFKQNPKEEHYVKASLPPGKEVGSVVQVRVLDLYTALQGTVGVNHPDYRPREGQNSDEAHGQKPSPA